jgi:hypothetical protein
MMNFHDRNRQCHPERSEESVLFGREILRCAQDDKTLPILLVNLHYHARTGV